MKNSEKTLDMIVNLCKNRGFIYPGSEIYGGLANSWDYGPLGVEFKNNVKKAWMKKFVQESPYNVGLDAAPRLPHQPQDLSPADGHIDVLEHLDGPTPGKGTAALAVKTVELANLQNGFHGLTPVSVWWEWPR